MSYFDPIIQTNTNYGKILPLQTHYGANQPYWAVAGSTGSASTINTAVINASTINTEFLIVSDEITANNGINNTNAPITSVAQNIIATEGAVLASVDGDCRTKIGTIAEELAYVEMAGHIGTDRDFRVAVGGVNAQPPFETDKLGIYVNSGDATPFVTALTVDVSGVSVPGTVQTEQASGARTQHTVKMFNTVTADLGQLMPMATIYNSGTIEFGAGSGIAHYGLMAPNATHMTIPTTTYSGATTVVMAPFTSLILYTGPSGSGGSTQYINQGNPYFSTFTAEPALNNVGYNSYVMFFGN